jgi:serine phosphatase RsbU (regulator of sigma subunit)
VTTLVRQEDGPIALTRADRLTVLVAVVLVGLLYLTKLQSYVLFHSMAEIVFVVVCLSVIIMAWSLYQFLDDDFAIFLGVALIAVATLHVVHLIDYPGLGLVSASLDSPTQLWLAARFLLAASLIASAFVIGRRLDLRIAALCLVGYVVVVLGSIYWWQVFPETLHAGGLTTFKKLAEWGICALLLVAAFLLWRRRDGLPGGTWRLLRAALISSVVAEVFFTLYQVASAWPNMLGHFFLVVSALLLFRAVVDDGLARPHALAVNALSEAEAMHRRLEQGLMPSLPVDRPGLSVLSSYLPGEQRLQLSGDFIDVLDRGDAGVAVICGDVSGHGANPAALGAMLRASWQALCAGGVDAVTMVESLREVIVRERQSEATYATLCLAWLDPHGSELRLMSLGHPLPLLIAGCDVTPLPVKPVPPLGLWEHPVTEPATMPLPAGWKLFFYTDGLVEGRMAPDSSERFGQERLVETVERLCCESADDRCLEELLDEVQAAGCEPFRDDVSAILISGQAGA